MPTSENMLFFFKLSGGLNPNPWNRPPTLVNFDVFLNFAGWTTSDRLDLDVNSSKASANRIEPAGEDLLMA